MPFQALLVALTVCCSVKVYNSVDRTITHTLLTYGLKVDTLMLCENLYSRPFFALISAKLISAKNLPIYSSLSLNIKTKVAWHDPVLPQEDE